MKVVRISRSDTGQCCCRVLVPNKLHPSSVVAVAGRQHLQHATAASTWMLTKGSQCVEFLSTIHQFIRPSHQGQASFSRRRPLLPISPIKLPITPHGRHPPSPHPPPKLPAWSRKRYRRRRRRRRRWPCPHCLPCVLCPAAGAAACSVCSQFLLLIVAVHCLPPTTATVPLTECPTLDSDHGPRRPSAPSQILHRPPAAGLARWLLAHRYPTIRRRRRRPCSVKVLVQLLSEILPHLRHHSPAARLEAKSSDPSFASPSQSSRRHPSLRRSSP